MIKLLSYHTILLQSVYQRISINNHVFKTTRKMNHLEEEELKDAIGKSTDYVVASWWCGQSAQICLGILHMNLSPDHRNQTVSETIEASSDADCHFTNKHIDCVQVQYLLLYKLRTPLKFLLVTFTVLLILYVHNSYKMYVTNR